MACRASCVPLLFENAPLNALYEGVEAAHSLHQNGDIHETA